jgi:hypothetical protein
VTDAELIHRVRHRVRHLSELDSLTAMLADRLEAANADAGHGWHWANYWFDYDKHFHSTVERYRTDLTAHNARIRGK